MRKLRILLLLISIPFIAMEANSLSTHKTKIIRWHYLKKTPVPITVEAILDEKSIEVRFLENVDKQVIFQVKDQQGNIIFEDMMVTSNKQDNYKIDLKGFKAGQYELLYLDEGIELIGTFEIE